MSATRSEIVFLFDVDNTLLDNDRIAADLRDHLTREFGAERQTRYWAIFEQLRGELGYADYLGALQRYRDVVPQDARLLEMSSFLLDYPFRDRLYPHALDVLARLRGRGLTAILSDGDVVFQPRKVDRSGIAAAVEGRVLIYVHKEKELPRVEEAYPAARYVLVDDKIHILAQVKRSWGARVTTVFPRQGHYAHDAALLAANPRPDVTLEAVGDLLAADVDALLAAGARAPKEG